MSRSLTAAFIDHIRNSHPDIANKFTSKLQARQRSDEKIIELTVYLFEGLETKIAELQLIQQLWNPFVEAAYIGFTASPLSVVGTVFHSPVTEFGWIHPPE